MPVRGDSRRLSAERSRLAQAGGSSRRQFADVFVPDGGVGKNVSSEHFRAFRVIEVDDVDAMFAEPVEAAGEVSAFADYQGADVELADEAAAIPAWSESGDHDQVAVGTLPAGATEGVCFAMDGRVALLDAAIVAAAEQGAILVEESGADGDASFGESEAGFVERDGKHVPVKRCFRMLQLNFHGNRHPY
jgi:hypothetical protein